MPFHVELETYRSKLDRFGFKLSTSQIRAKGCVINANLLFLKINNLFTTLNWVLRLKSYEILIFAVEIINQV